MTKKEKFIKAVEDALFSKIDLSELDPDVVDYWNALKATKNDGKPKFTENGKKVLAFVKENKDTYNNLFKAKDIGVEIGISSRTVSGAMRKLVTDGYIEKIGESPVVYSLTELGAQVNLSAE